MDDVKLTPTAHVVLGLLSFGQDLSGYELRRWSERSVGFWYTTPAQSQIYRELENLERAGLVEATDVPQPKRPDKRVFSITESGRAQLAAWVAGTPARPPTLKHHHLLRLFLSHDTPSQPLIETLWAHQEWLHQVLDELETQLVALDGSPGSERAVAVADWAAEIYRGDLRGTENALKALTS
jgi:DNA-binding PadR family transcriptional regulator